MRRAKAQARAGQAWDGAQQATVQRQTGKATAARVVRGAHPEGGHEVGPVPSTACWWVQGAV